MEAFILQALRHAAEMANGLKLPLASPSMVLELPGLTGYVGLQNKDCFPLTPPAMICE